jgi:hypothetical protein
VKEDLLALHWPSMHAGCLYLFDSDTLCVIMMDVDIVQVRRAVKGVLCWRDAGTCRFVHCWQQQDVLNERVLAGGQKTLREATTTTAAHEHTASIPLFANNLSMCDDDVCGALQWSYSDGDCVRERRDGRIGRARLLMPRTVVCSRCPFHHRATTAPLPHQQCPP